MHFTRAFRFFLVAAVASLLFTCQLRAQQGPPQLSETGPLSRISGPISSPTQSLWPAIRIPWPALSSILVRFPTRRGWSGWCCCFSRTRPSRQRSTPWWKRSSNLAPTSFASGFLPKNMAIASESPQSDLARVISWLQDHGFTVEPVSPSRRIILFSGTASQVAEAFHTEIHRLRCRRNNPYRQLSGSADSSRAGPGHLRNCFVARFSAELGNYLHPQSRLNRSL
jgi:hypothetical protein